MLDVFVWLILFLLFSGLALLFHYWYELISGREEYTRNELVGFAKILPGQFKKLTEQGDKILNFISLGVGIIVAWLLTLFGGLVSPDVSRAPDFASDQIPNYFFQSFLFPGILHLVWPAFREIISTNIDKENVISKLLKSDLPFFFTLCAALPAINFAVWGIYHEFSFLYCLINSAACLAYIGFRLHQGLKEKAESEIQQTDIGGDY